MKKIIKLCGMLLLTMLVARFVYGALETAFNDNNEKIITEHIVVKDLEGNVLYDTDIDGVY